MFAQEIKEIEKIKAAIEWMGMEPKDYEVDRRETIFPTMNNKKVGFQAQLRCAGEADEYVCFNKKDTINCCIVYTKTILALKI